jgi:HNH endonuclease
MEFGFNPYSKADQLKGHQREKPKPRYKERRYNRRKRQSKKVDYKGVKIPSRAKRAEFTKEDKEKIKEFYGDTCLLCGSPYIEFHHRKYRSQLGRNNPRNGAPLCEDCHIPRVHKDPKLAQELRDEAEKRFGPYYYYDKYDCWKKGLIERPTDELFNKFMEEEEERAKLRLDGMAKENHS